MLAHAEAELMMNARMNGLRRLSSGSYLRSVDCASKCPFDGAKTEIIASPECAAPLKWATLPWRHKTISSMGQEHQQQAYIYIYVSKGCA
jgi:hypothetical protein